MCLYLFEMKQMLRERPLFVLPFHGLCVLPENKKQKNEKAEKHPGPAPGQPAAPATPGIPPLRPHRSSVLGSPTGTGGPAPIPPPRSAASLELRRPGVLLLFLRVKPKHITDRMHRCGQKKGPAIIPKVLTPHRGPAAPGRLCQCVDTCTKRRNKNHQLGRSHWGKDVVC